MEWSFAPGLCVLFGGRHEVRPHTAAFSGQAPSHPISYSLPQFELGTFLNKSRPKFEPTGPD